MRNEKRSGIPRRLNDIIFEELFEQVPFNVAVIDRNYNVVMANRNFTEYFGDWKGKKCYKVYKKLDEPCGNCPSVESFKKGRAIVADSVGIDQHGRKTHYIGHVFPIRSRDDGEVDYILEMTTPVTKTDRWQTEYQILFDRVPCYVTVIDEDYRIVRANEAFRDKFGDVYGKHCFEVYKKKKSKCTNCPASKTFQDGMVHSSTQIGIGRGGQDVHYAVSTSPLLRGEDNTAHVIEISTDVTHLKKLEHQIIDAERLAAVGQTVAGLAHSIKNILMGLEGGKYIVSLGLKNEDSAKIAKGWEMLERNFEKTTTLVKDFLSFSKGRLPVLKMIDPKTIVSEIVDLYKDIASQSGIELKAEFKGKIKKAPLDPDGIHTCLTNLVSNAIDACQMSVKKGTEVLIKLSDSSGTLYFDVSDNGSGIDHEIKKKIFTTFFTTKGGEGTGLGLLTTRKIVQEHGGTISVESKKGKGSRFRMEFPRKRLMMLYEDAQSENK